MSQNRIYKSSMASVFPTTWWAKKNSQAYLFHESGTNSNEEIIQRKATGHESHNVCIATRVSIDR
jgi:hypothetical protein